MELELQKYKLKLEINNLKADNIYYYYAKKDIKTQISQLTNKVSYTKIRELTKQYNQFTYEQEVIKMQIQQCVDKIKDIRIQQLEAELAYFKANSPSADDTTGSSSEAGKTAITSTDDTTGSSSEAVLTSADDTTGSSSEAGKLYEDIIIPEVKPNAVKAIDDTTIYDYDKLDEDIMRAVWNPNLPSYNNRIGYDIIGEFFDNTDDSFVMICLHDKSKITQEMNLSDVIYHVTLANKEKYPEVWSVRKRKDITYPSI